MTSWILVVWFAANRFGDWCAIKVALTGLCLIGFLLLSGRHTAHLEKTRSDAKDYTEDFRYDREISNFAAQRN
jgi:hypothetical protein